MLDREHGFVDLRVGLHRVASVDEDGGLVGQHDSGAGRAGEAGQPGETFLARRQIFVLLAVRARHDETCEAVALELRAQAGDAARALIALARVLESLELGFKHGRHSSGPRLSGKPRYRTVCAPARPSGAGPRSTCEGQCRPPVSGCTKQKLSYKV